MEVLHKGTSEGHCCVLDAIGCTSSGFSQERARASTYNDDQHAEDVTTAPRERHYQDCIATVNDSGRFPWMGARAAKSMTNNPSAEFNGKAS